MWFCGVAKIGHHTTSLHRVVIPAVTFWAGHVGLDDYGHGLRAGGYPVVRPTYLFGDGQQLVRFKVLVLGPGGRENQDGHLVRNPIIDGWGFRLGNAGPLAGSGASPVCVPIASQAEWHIPDGAKR